LIVILCLPRVSNIDINKDHANIVEATALGRTVYDNDIVEKNVSLFNEEAPDTNNSDLYATWLNTDCSFISYDQAVVDNVLSSTAHTEVYRKAKSSAFTMFVRACVTCSKLKYLFDTTSDENSGAVIFNLQKLCSGAKTPAKRVILNHCLLRYACFSGVKDEHQGKNIYEMAIESFAAIALEPSTIATRHKMIFAVLRQNMGMTYLLKDFNFPGGFTNWWTQAFDRIKSVRPLYATKPKQAVVQLDYFKLIMNAEKPFKPYENYDDLLNLLMFRMCIELCKRAGKEVRHKFLL
jgi:hypothetical protein